jgi:KUP system potassium uptake protein
MPAVNWTLMTAAIALVLAFRSSASLAGAYGVSVNGTMMITTILAFNVARERGGWSLAQAGAFLILFLTIDLAFLTANAETIRYGGWFPVAMGAVIFTLIITWRRGTELLIRSFEANSIALETLVGRLENDPPDRVSGTGVFFTARAEEVPKSMMRLITHNKMLSSTAIIVNVKVERVPRIPLEERIHVEALGQGLYQVRLRYGFMQGFNVPSDLALCIERKDLPVSLDEVTYFVGRTSVIPGRKAGGMMTWRDRLFSYMVRNTSNATDLYQIPSTRVVEIGLQLGI